MSSWSRAGAPTTPYGGRGAPTPKSKQATNFSFPLLPVKDILTCLEELSFTVSEKELTEPEKNVQSVRRLFEYLLEVLTATRKEELNMPVFTAHQNMAWPQLHEDSIPELAFWRALAKLMAVCGVNDFARDDLARPDPKRLRKQLSGLINFAKFREERMELYHRVTVARDTGLDRVATLDQENAQLGAQLDDLKVATKTQREEIKALDDRTSQEASLVNAKNEEQSSLRHASGELKKRNNELKEQLGEASLEHTALLAEVSKLQSQVVHSPERVRREMHESQRALQQERRDGEAAEAAALVAQTAAKAVVDACGKVSDATSAVGDILDLSNKCIEVGHSIKAREASIQSNRKDAAEVAESAVELERQTARLAEKLQQLEASAAQKAAAAAQANEHSRNKLLEERRRKAATATHSMDEERQIEQLALQLETERRAQEQQMATLGAAWQRLEATVHHQQQQLRAVTTGMGPALGMGGQGFSGLHGSSEAANAVAQTRASLFNAPSYDAYSALPPTPAAAAAPAYYPSQTPTAQSSVYSARPPPASEAFSRYGETPLSAISSSGYTGR